VLVEPPRPCVPDRARPAHLNAPPRRVRLRSRTGPAAPVPETATSAGDLPVLRLALGAGALVVAVASRGDVYVLAVLLGFAAGRRRAGLAVALALVASSVRWGSPSLGAIAGAQAVLGPAGWTGSAAAVGSAWFAAAALVLAAAPIDRGWPWRMASVAPFGLAAADVVAGPGPGGAIAVRVLASAIACAAAAALPDRRARDAFAVAAAVVALGCAGVAR
jgi:hypothetical protein